MLIRVGERLKICLSHELLFPISKSIIIT